MHQVPVAVETAFLITRPGIEHRPVGQHGPALVRQIVEIAVAFQAVAVFDGGIGFLPIFFVVVRGLGEMRHDILGPVIGLGVKKVEGVLRRGKMAVHAVRHEALAVIDVGGGPPGVVGKFDFVAGGTKLRGGGAHHGVVGEAEQGEGHDNPKDDIKNRLEKFFHGTPREKRVEGQKRSYYIVRTMRNIKQMAQI